MHIQISSQGRKGRCSSCWQAAAPLAMLVPVLALCFSASALAGEPHGRVVVQGAETGQPVEPVVFDGSLLDLPRAEGWEVGDPVTELPVPPSPAGRELAAGAAPQTLPDPDPLAERQARVVTSPSKAWSIPVESFPGFPYTGVDPGDPVGDVSATYYVQAVNGPSGALVAVLNKSGTVVVPATSMDSIPSSGPCQVGAGTPRVLYDSLATRWLMAELSSGGDMCVYVSQTSSPVSGGWYVYAFSPPAMPYVANYGVWSDAYYVTAYESSTPHVYALQRSRMLLGLSASMQDFALTGLPGYGTQAFSPADLDGPTAPPSGAPGVIMRHVDDEAHGGSAPFDGLDLYEVDIDWSIPANSTVTDLGRRKITDYNSWLVDYSTLSAIPQPGTTTRLESMREMIMPRLAYRNLGSHESIVGNFVTNQYTATSGGNVSAAVRWFELRRAGGVGGTWGVNQEGTFNGTGSLSENRWMGAIAIDGGGNIALGYSFTRTGTLPLYPSLGRTGHSADAADGVMDREEKAVATGTTYQTPNRWGRSGAMSVDPVDECTFWQSGVYRMDGGWQTRIVGFNFDNPTSVSVTPNASASNPIVVCSGMPVLLTATASGGDHLNYQWLQNGSAYGDNSPTLTVGHSAGTYSYNCEVTAASCTGGVRDSANTWVTWQDMPIFAGAAWVVAMTSNGCGLRVGWEPATPCEGKASVVYNVYRSTSPTFTPDPTNRIATCVPNTFYDDPYLTPKTTYFYIVRAEDSRTGWGGPCNGGYEDTNLERVSPLWFDNLESYANMSEAEYAGWAHGADLGVDDWDLVGGSFVAPAPDSVADKFIISPELRIGPTAELRFQHYYSYQPSYDGGVLEISTDGGSSWTYVENTHLLNNGYDFTLSSSFGNPLGGFAAWSGSSEPVTAVFADLSAWAGNWARLRWRMGTDTQLFTGAGTWQLHQFQLDNRTVTACHALEDPLPFESGTARNERVRLEWLNPPPPSSGTAYETTRLCFSTVDFPADPENCANYQDCGQDKTCTTPGAGPGDYDAWTFTPLSNDTTYYFSGFVQYRDTQSGEIFYSAANNVPTYPFDSTIGAVRWGFHTGASALVPPGLGSLFALTNTKGIFSLNWGSGGGGWITGSSPLAMTAPAQSRPPVINFTMFPIGSHTKVVFIGVQDGTVVAMDGNDGSEIWGSADFGTFLAAPVGVFREFGDDIGSDMDLLLIGTRNVGADNAIIALDPHNAVTPNQSVWQWDNYGGGIGIISGTATWVFDTVESEYRLYFASRERDASHQGTLWCIAFEAAGADLCSGYWPVELGNIDGSPIVKGGYVYVGDNLGKVYKVNASTGAPAWTSPYITNDGAVKGYVSPDLASNALYLATTNRVWRLLDNGETVGLGWSLANISQPSVPLFAPNSSYLYVGGGDGRLYQVNVTGPTTTYQALGLAAENSSAVGSPALDVVNDMLYVGTEAGALYAVDVPF